MKKLIWRIRYAREIKRLTALPWSSSWELACIATDEYKDWHKDCPIDHVSEELSYWSE